MKKVALVGVLALSAALTLAGCVTTETSSTVDGTSDTTSSTTSSSTSDIRSPKVTPKAWNSL